MAANELSNHIRRLRFERGEMTQQQLADRVGVSRQTIIALEANRYVPSLTLAMRIAATFELRVEDIFELNDRRSNRHPL